MKGYCCDCTLWFDLDDGYGLCECDGKIRFCTHKCPFVNPQEDDKS